MSRKIIAVDFDNTLTNDKGSCKVNIVSWVKEQYRKGNVIIIFTAREWTDIPEITSFLSKYGIRYHGIRCEKPSADVYLDDKNVKLEDIYNGEVLI